jgi:hypothetical protein
MSMLGRLSESVESGLARIEGRLKRADEYIEGVNPWRRRLAVAVVLVVVVGVSAARGQSAEHIVSNVLFAALLGAVAQSIWWLGSVPPGRRWREYRDRRYLKRRREAPDTRQ